MINHSHCSLVTLSLYLPFLIRGGVLHTILHIVEGSSLLVSLSLNAVYVCLKKGMGTSGLTTLQMKM